MTRHARIRPAGLRPLVLAVIVSMVVGMISLVTLVVAPSASAAGTPLFGAPSATALDGNPGGGTPASLDCPAGSALVSVTVTVAGVRNGTEGDWVNGVTATCSPIQVVAGALHTGTPADAGTAVGSGDSVDTQSTGCSADSVVTGLADHAGALVDSIALTCHTLEADGVKSGTSSVGGGVGGPGGAARPGLPCAYGSVATGVAARVGQDLDAIGLTCAPLSLADPVSSPTFGAATQTTDDNTTGDPIPGECPAGSVVTGATVGLSEISEGDYLNSIEGACAPVDVTNGAASVLADSSTTGNLAGSGGSFAADNGTASCPARTVATGADDGVTIIGEGIDDTRVRTVQFHCIPIAPDGTFTGPQSQSGTAGATGNSLGSGTQDCAAGSFVTGLVLYGGGAGDDMQGLGLICRPLTFGAVPITQPDNSGWPNATLLNPSDDIDQALTSDGQSRWYRFPVTPGSRVTIDLTALSADYDLSLYKDISQSFTALTTTKDLLRLSAEFASDAFSPQAFSPQAFSPQAFSPQAFSPQAFSPQAFSPQAFSPQAFSPQAFSPQAFSPQAFSPQAFSPSVSLPQAFSPQAFSPQAFSPQAFSDAFSSAQTRSLIAVSAHDGTAPENISTATWNNSGYFYLRVSGRNGAFGPNPYHLAVRTTGGPCTGVTLDSHAGDATLSGVPGASTVILTDPTRMPGSAADKATLAATLTTFAARVGGAIVDVSKSPKVAALNAQADDAGKSCPYAKNLVAQAVRDIVNSYRDTQNTLKYVVIVGNDHAIPFFRYADGAGLGPESDYVPPVADTSASQASLRSSTVLGQDAYGARTDISLKGATMPVPDLAVGRLVETPSEITGVLANYLGLRNGSITPGSSLVTGYDFLSSGAHEVADDFAAGISAGKNDTLITNQGVPTTSTTVGGKPSPTTSWTATDLRAQLLAQRHDLVYLAGHFSANSALAADFSSTLLTTDLAAAPAANFTNTVVLSAGCHSGYNIVDSDGIPGVTLGLDWAEAFAQKGATLVAGTGYQYGDTDFVKYSTKLYADLSRELRYGTGAVALGTALTNAKQQYLNDAPTLEGIDQKALLEATLYGLPMLGVNLPTGRITPPSDPSVVTASDVAAGPGHTLGLRTAALTLNPTLATHTKALISTADQSTVNTTYLSGDAGTQSSPTTPTLPLTSANVSVDGAVLRGVLFRSGTYTDTPGIVPLTGAPATDTSGSHAPFAPSTFFPNRLTAVNYFDALAGGGSGVTRLFTTPAQYQADSVGSLTDIQRQYSQLGLQLFYSSNVATYGANQPALAAPPSMSGIVGTASSDGTSVDIDAHVTGDPSAGIQQVLVTYTGVGTSAFHGSWASLDMTQDASDSTLWHASLPLPAGQSARDVRFLVQAVNGVGLVGADDNQGAYYTPGVTAGLVDPARTGTTITFAADARTAAYGSTLPMSATLIDATGAPVVGRTVVFSLAGASATARTGATGVASAVLPLTAQPGGYTATVGFEGDAVYAAATGDSAAVTVTRQATALALAAATKGAVQATLTSGPAPLANRTVVFVVTRTSDGTVLSTVPSFTNGAGVATLPTASVPAGDVTVTALSGVARTPLPGGAVTDLSDPVYAPSTSTALRRATLVTSALPRGTLNAPYSAQLTVVGTAAVTVTAAGLPAGVTLAKTSAGYTLSGTPRVAGRYPVALTVDNGIGPRTAVTLPLVVGYVVGPFLAPVVDPPGAAISVFAAKSTVLARFRISDGAGVPVPLPTAASLVLRSQVRLTVTQTGTTTAKANQPVSKLPEVPRRALLYNPFDATFLTVLGPTNSGFVGGRTYTITVTVTGADGTVLGTRSVVIGIAK